MAIFSHIFTTVSTNAKSAIGLLCTFVYLHLVTVRTATRWRLQSQNGRGRGRSTKVTTSIGDVVWVVDPIDGVTQHPMRIVATEGDTIQYLNDGFVLNGRRISVLDMPRMGF